MKPEHILGVLLILVALAIPFGVVLMSGRVAEDNSAVATDATQQQSGQQKTPMAKPDPDVKPVWLESDQIVVPTQYGFSLTVIARIKVAGEEGARAICERYQRVADKIQVVLSDHQDIMKGGIINSNEADRYLTHAVSDVVGSQYLYSVDLIDKDSLSTVQSDITRYNCYGTAIRALPGY